MKNKTRALDFLLLIYGGAFLVLYFCCYFAHEYFNFIESIIFFFVGNTALFLAYMFNGKMMIPQGFFAFSNAGLVGVLIGGFLKNSSIDFDVAIICYLGSILFLLIVNFYLKYFKYKIVFLSFLLVALASLIIYCGINFEVVANKQLMIMAIVLIYIVAGLITYVSIETGIWNIVNMSLFAHMGIAILIMMILKDRKKKISDFVGLSPDDDIVNDSSEES